MHTQPLTPTATWLKSLLRDCPINAARLIGARPRGATEGDVLQALAQLGARKIGDKWALGGGITPKAGYAFADYSVLSAPSAVATIAAFRAAQHPRTADDIFAARRRDVDAARLAAPVGNGRQVAATPRGTATAAGIFAARKRQADAARTI